MHFNTHSWHRTVVQICKPMGGQLWTYVVRNSRVNEVTHKLHHAAVGVPVVERGGGDGTLDDVDDDAAAEQCDGTPLDEAGGQSEQVVHSVGVVSQTVLLL